MEWYEGLSRVFLTSLKLRALLELRGQNHIFRWPRADDNFDPNVMVAAENIGNNLECKVQMALSPALIQTSSSESIEGCSEETIFHATVLLQ